MAKIFQRTKKGKGLYWALIGTFIALYVAVAFVSTLHAITFFQLTNILGMAILLGAAYEIGQAAVLFSILTTENKNRLLAWGMMFLLTALQVTANVYASFKFMDASQSNDWTYWQRAILIGVQADSSETYKVIISWISGALLPLVALGMTALVADNIKLAKAKDEEGSDGDIEKERIDEIVENEVQKRLLEMDKEEDVDVDEAFELLKEETPSDKGVTDKELWDKMDEISELLESQDEEGEYLKRSKENLPGFANKVKQALDEDMFDTELLDIQNKMVAHEERTPEHEKMTIEDLKRINEEEGVYPKPVNKMRGWHLMKEYVDEDHNVFSKGAFVKNDPEKIPTSKKE